MEKLPKVQVPSYRNVLVIDGSYANIGARNLESGRMNYIKLRTDLESMIENTFTECWYFDSDHHGKGFPSHNLLRCAPPVGPKFQVKEYTTKRFSSRCPACTHEFYQRVQKGVDIGIATKMMSLAYENLVERIILLAGDGDFFDTLDHIRNVLRKDIWIVGFRDTVSAELQQLATKVLWLEDLYPRSNEKEPILEEVNEHSDETHQLNSSGSDSINYIRPNTVFVDNIAHDLKEEPLRILFGQCGIIQEIRLPIDRDTGRSRGFAFIDFMNNDAGTKALSLNGSEFHGRKLRVRQAYEKCPYKMASNELNGMQDLHTKESIKRRVPNETGQVEKRLKREFHQVATNWNLQTPSAIDSKVQNSSFKEDFSANVASNKRNTSDVVLSGQSRQQQRFTLENNKKKVESKGIDMESILKLSSMNPLEMEPILSNEIRDAAGNTVIDLCFSDEE